MYPTKKRGRKRKIDKLLEAAAEAAAQGNQSLAAANMTAAEMLAAAKRQPLFSPAAAATAAAYASLPGTPSMPGTPSKSATSTPATNTPNPADPGMLCNNRKCCSY